MIAIGPQESCEFFHDPSMKSSNAVSKRRAAVDLEVGFWRSKYTVWLVRYSWFVAYSLVLATGYDIADRHGLVFYETEADMVKRIKENAWIGMNLMTVSLARKLGSNRRQC
ncbi:hypothetical protein KIW84_042674 [Lathyrus oleraceus]|uniref:Uncharacterized protein n=1 Tax=Pisum sativum TaxID=3888 RepID=A0A9D4XD53_PEA|nr:hypothetical protein KIW84_042674 [Pisum sativum]